MTTSRKIKSLSWFARQPNYWPHAIALFSRYFRPDRDTPELAAQAAQWAEGRATALDTVIKRIGYAGVVRATRTLIGPNAYDAAERRVAQCPVVMGGAGDLRLLYYACEATGARRVLETGVAYGWSSLAIMTSLSQRAGTLLASVDMPYRDRHNEAWVGVVVPPEWAANWSLIRRPDRYGIDTALKKLGGAIDLCHYDSDKSYYGRIWAYPRLWSALRAGGVLISDDIQDNLAFKEFSQACAAETHIVRCENKFVGLCVKA